MNVDLSALTGFAHDVGIQADHLAGTLPTVMEALIRTGEGAGRLSSPTAEANEAILSFAEHTSFFSRYGALCDAGRQLMTDAQLGLAALAGAAEVIAINYANTDQLHAAMLQRAKDGLDAGHLVSAMDVPLTGSANVPLSAVETAFAPPAQQRPPAVQPTGHTTGATAADPRTEAEFRRRVKQAAAEQHNPSAQEGGYTVGTVPNRIVVPADKTPDRNLGDPNQLPV